MSAHTERPHDFESWMIFHCMGVSELLNHSPMNSRRESLGLLLWGTKLPGYLLHAWTTVTAEQFATGRIEVLARGCVPTDLEGVDRPSYGAFHFAPLPKTYESVTNRAGYHTFEFLPIWYAKYISICFKFAYLFFFLRVLEQTSYMFKSHLYFLFLQTVCSCTWLTLPLGGWSFSYYFVERFIYQGE